MTRARDILYRFRPAGSPGAAGTAGVPVDRAAGVAAELEPLFARLADTEAACVALVDRARSDAAVRRTRAAESARAQAAAVQDEAEAERAAAAAAAERAGGSELATLLVDADGEARAVRERAATLIPGYVARVVTLVRSRGVGPIDEQGVA